MAACVEGSEAVKNSQGQAAVAELRGSMPCSCADEDEGAGPGPSSSNASRRPSMPPISPRWVPYKQHQGVTIYRYASPAFTSAWGLSGEYLTCAPVRGAPGAVLTALMASNSTATVLGPAVQADVLSNTSEPDGTLRQMLRLVIEAPGWAGRMCAPREWLLELTATREPSMHIVCFTTVDSEDAQQAQAQEQEQPLEPTVYRSLYHRPVKGKARGTFAIAPLEGHSLDTSPETLISCIMKVDLGGACGDGSSTRTLTEALGWCDAFLDQILLAPLLLRDAVEHSRFTVKPEALLALPTEAEAEEGVQGRDAVLGALARWQEGRGLAGVAARAGAAVVQVSGAGAADGFRSAAASPEAAVSEARGLLGSPARPQLPQDANGTAAASSPRKVIMSLLRHSLTRGSHDVGEGRNGGAGAGGSQNAVGVSMDGTVAAGVSQPGAAPSAHNQHAGGVRALLEASTFTHASTVGGTNLSTMSVVTSVDGVGLDNGKASLSSDLVSRLGSRPSGLGVLDMDRIKRLASLEYKFWEPIHAPGKACPLRVRGKKYLVDRRKIPAGMAAFQFAALDVITTPHVVEHVARFLPSIREGRIPFAFVINLIIPGTPLLGIVATFATDRHPDVLGSPPRDPEAPGHGWTSFDFVLHKFINGDTPTRNLMLKLIPHIADGSWVVKNSVGTKPVITGKALKTTYHLTPQYMEIDIDVSANQVAAYVTGLVRGATKSLVIDIGFVLEGTKTWELPERLLGAIRVNWLDLAYAKPLDTSRELPLLPAVPI